MDPEFCRTRSPHERPVSGFGEVTPTAPVSKKGDFQDGAEDSVDQSGALELVSALKPQPVASFFLRAARLITATLPIVCLGDEYTDLDGVKRQGDWAADGVGTGSHKTVMYGPTKTDRPQILSAPFQSVAELGRLLFPRSALENTRVHHSELG